MSIEFLSTQPLQGFCYGEPEQDVKMAPELSVMYSTQDGWSSRSSNPYMTASSHTHFSMPSGFMSHRTVPSKPDSHMSYSSPATLISTDTIPKNHDATTVSPLQTCFTTNEPSPQSCTSSTFDFSDVPPSSNLTQGQQVSHRKDSSQTTRPHPFTTKQRNGGRRQKPESAEVGTARAIYLEKNRKAASKCRTKQKRQQEGLVEEARDSERRNKILKMEVEILRSNLRDLMDIVGHHANCPDSRLLRYVQLEADRLAAGRSLGSQATDISKSSPHDWGNSSPTTTCSPADQ